MARQWLLPNGTLVEETGTTQWNALGVLVEETSASVLAVTIAATDSSDTASITTVTTIASIAATDSSDTTSITASAAAASHTIDPVFFILGINVDLQAA